ncbi:serine carboxypeptidase S28, partial [Helicosporidium sp. ATCC 50920]
MLVFAEHRYYGESKPFPGKTLRKHMHYLTTEQAMADYATLIWDLRAELGQESAPVIGFGGSYGGMLATWFRLKYPHLMDGAVAGSAPIWTFLGENPPYDAGSFARIVTRDASPEGGSAPACAPNARSAWQALFELSDSSQGRSRARRALRLCPSVRLESKEDGVAVANWAQGAWDYLAMGNFPYAS